VPRRSPTPFRTIGRLADLVGGYCWVEGRLFQLCGEWASQAEPAADPEVSVFLAALSRHHGDLAARWSDRLPVRAGVNPAALVVAPPGPEAVNLSRLDQAASPLARLAGLVEVVLPDLLHAYGAFLESASAVSEAPVMAVLGPARLTGSWEVGRGHSLLARLTADTGVTGAAAELLRNLLKAET
jgi:hypothetical protein